jgi:hypothetical protein
LSTWTRETTRAYAQSHREREEVLWINPTARDALGGRLCVLLDAFYVDDDNDGAEKIEAAKRALARAGLTLEPEIGWRGPERATP